MKHFILNLGLAVAIATGVLAEPPAAQAAPAVVDIAGATFAAAGISNGLVDMSIGRAWNGHRVVNDLPGSLTWTLRGREFGPRQGTVTLAGRTVTVLSWSDSAIRIDPTGAAINPSRPWDWQPLTTNVVVRTATGTTASKSVQIVPSVVTRVFSQCTWHCAVARKRAGLAPSPTAYGGYTTIGSSWRPKRGDQLQWSGHCAYIEEAAAPTTAADGTVTIRVRISQYNGTGRNEFSEFWTTFSYRGSTVLAKPKFSANSAQANSFYR